MEGYLNNTNEKDAQLEKALTLRMELQERLSLGDFPNPEYIEICREIIRNLPDTEDPADRSERFPKSVKKKLQKRFSGCIACGETATTGGRHSPVLEVHHIIPRQFSGDDSAENGALFCRSCHVETHLP